MFTVRNGSTDNVYLLSLEACVRISFMEELITCHFYHNDCKNSCHVNVTVRLTRLNAQLHPFQQNANSAVLEWFRRAACFSAIENAALLVVWYRFSKFSRCLLLSFRLSLFLLLLFSDGLSSFCLPPRLTFASEPRKEY